MRSMRRRDRSAAENRCLNCDAFLTPQYVRVFGDNRGRVDGCLECERRGADRY